MNELLQTHWPQIAAAVAAVVYVLRVEGRLNHVEKVQETEGARMVKAMETMSDAQTKMSDKIADMRETLVSIQSYREGANAVRKRGQR